MGSSRRKASNPPSRMPDNDPEYLLAVLHRQFEQATGFARLCRHVSPELELASYELVEHETALFEAASASVLGQSAPGRLEPLSDKSVRGRASQKEQVGSEGTPAPARAAIQSGVAKQSPQR